LRTALTLSIIGFRLESGIKTTSNKITKLERVSRGESYQESPDEGFGQSNSEKCRGFAIHIIFSRGGDPYLLFAARIRNQLSRYLAINRRENPKALNTIT